MSDTVSLRLMLFRPEELAKALPETIGVYERKGPAYRILLADGPDLTLVFGNLLAAALKDHELHDRRPYSSSISVARPGGRLVFTYLTPNNSEIKSYATRVGQVLTQSMDRVEPVGDLARRLFQLAADAAQQGAGIRWSLKNSIVGLLITTLRADTPCAIDVNGTIIEGIDAQIQDHDLLVQLRKGVASLD